MRIYAYSKKKKPALCLAYELSHLCLFYAASALEKAHVRCYIPDDGSGELSVSVL